MEAPIRSPFFWVAGKEPELSYHNPETICVYIYIYIHMMVI